MSKRAGGKRGASPARHVTPELVRSALGCIPPEVERETWVRVAMAVKSELGDAGFSLWNDWSAQAVEYSEADARSTWRSVKAGGAVTIGTLFGIAKDHGFRFPDGATDAATVQASAQAAEAERARLEEQRQREREGQAQQWRERADRAAKVAAELWAEGSDEGSSGYLVRKGVKPHGVRFLPDGTLLVPMRDRDGQLQNLQRIAPEKPSGDVPEKRFLAGGRKSELWHWIGEPEGAPVLLVAEGYATGASLHEATGRPVAVAFDAGNVRKVVPELQTLLPSAAVLMCADDDRATEAKTGKNPGRDSARAAVRAVEKAGGCAAVVLPQGLPEGGTDFNDLAASAGLDAVREQVEAVALPLAGRLWRVLGERMRAEVPAAGQASAGDAAEAQGGDDMRQADDERQDPFWLDERGVWFRPLDSERRPLWVCAPILVTACTRADDRNGWGYLLEFGDPDGNRKTWALPASMLSGDGAEWAARLRDMGLRIFPGPKPRSLLQQYIETRNPPDRVTCVDRVGWHGGRVFVLPGRVVGGDAQRREYVFQADGGVEDHFRQAGELVQWQRSVAAPCADNSRLAFAICCALAGPLLRPAGVQGGAFHYVSGSSQGKTTALRVAVSVWGAPTFMQQWRSSDNGLEGVALQYSETLLALDEVGQLDPRLIGDAAYLLANGREKVRARAAGGIRKARTWLSLVLSSGEKSMADLMGEAGKRVMAGQEVRFVDVPLDAGKEMGGLENLHGVQTPAEFVTALTRAAARFHGTAGAAWLEWLTQAAEQLPRQVRELIDAQCAQLLPMHAGEQVRRVAMRFALVAAAGELATQAGVTGWHAGQASAAVRSCFRAWLDARGHAGNGEEAAMLRQVRGFLERNGEALFTPTWRAMDDRNPKTLNRAGFRRLVDEGGKPIRIDAASEYIDERSVPESSDKAQAIYEYLVLPEAFRRDVCQGFDEKVVARLLSRKGHLQHDEGRLTCKQRLPGLGQSRCYHIRHSIFSEDL